LTTREYDVDSDIKGEKKAKNIFFGIKFSLKAGHSKYAKITGGRSMKRISLLMIVLVLVSGVVFAVGQAEDDGVYRVAYIARAQADSFAAWLANSVKEEAAKYPDIKLDVFDGQASDDIQNSMIENAITNNYDVIIVQPNNGESQRPYVERVVSSGIIAITTNARIAGIEGASSVDADPYEQAAVNARAAVKQVPQNAKVVVLNGPPGNFHADERRVSWQKEFFDKRPDVTIVGEKTGYRRMIELMQSSP
jgi:inositol transport system substrate-binding protein